MIKISDHAIQEMMDDNILVEEVYSCLENGSLEIKQFVDGELRYGKKLEFKDKIIMVIYTYRQETIKVVTCYTIRRKRWQKR
ncbi:DUF4258 domain-containing protein [Candidatus Woesearchaeota archaeon]|nr:DUF4258 domain-containing protein [Candidatus Woesearchaeota archaeon]